MRSLAALSALLLLVGCTSYRRGFDGTPGKGVTGASVTQIEAMIIETDKGADFIPGQGEQSACNANTLPSDLAANLGTRGDAPQVWVAPTRSPNGNVVGAHYLRLHSMGERAHA